MSIRRYTAKLAQGTSLTKVEGKDVLFSVRTGESFGLNETAAAMLARLLESDSVVAAQGIAREYAAPEDEIAADLRALAEELAGAKLLVLAD